MSRKWLIRILCSGLTLNFGTWMPNAAQANERLVSPWQPDNWYQAEVVIFTQGGVEHREAAPQKHQLKYPQRWLRLLDSDAVIDIRQLADAFASGINPESAAALARVNVQNNLPQTAVLADSSAAFIPRGPSSPAVIDAPPIATQPKFELPYRRLKAADRNLNDTQRALARRPPYEVIYHRAWRFPAQLDSDDPWLIVEGGSAFKDRFQLEGSVRFYKSRFLHFESNLWLTDFSDDTGVMQQMTLPVLKRHQKSLKSPTIDPTTRFVTLETAPLARQGLIVKSVPQPLTEGSNHGSNEGRYLMQMSSNLTASPAAGSSELAFKTKLLDGYAIPATDSLQSVNAYPVENVWTFNQSRRLHDAEVYYLDHPHMGIILTIKSYQPQLLNPQDNPLDTP